MADYREQVIFICPFCQQICSVGESSDGAGVKLPALIHAVPTCQKFDELEIDEFLHQVNVQFGAHN